MQLTSCVVIQLLVNGSVNQIAVSQYALALSSSFLIRRSQIHVIIGASFFVVCFRNFCEVDLLAIRANF
mgnify:CR=1 FL=1